MNKQEHIENLKSFLEKRLPIVQGKPEIHATRYRGTGKQQFDLFVITDGHQICGINFEVSTILGKRLTKKTERLTGTVVGSDAAHDAIRSLERVLGYKPYHFRYVEHWS